MMSHLSSRRARERRGGGAFRRGGFLLLLTFVPEDKNYRTESGHAPFLYPGGFKDYDAQHERCSLDDFQRV